MDGKTGNPAAAAPKGQMEAPRPAYDWYKRGEQDLADGRFDPPTHPDDRAAYDAGRDPDRELNP